MWHVEALPAERAADRRRPGASAPSSTTPSAWPASATASARPSAARRSTPTSCPTSRSSATWRAPPACCRSCRRSSAARWRSRIVASIDALLCAKLLARPGEPKADSDRLLMRLGAANVAGRRRRRHHRRLQHRPEPRQPRLRRAHAALGAGERGRAPASRCSVLFPALSFLPCVALSAVIMVDRRPALRPLDAAPAAADRRDLAGPPPQGAARPAGGPAGGGAVDRGRHRARGVPRRGDRRAAVHGAHEPLDRPPPVPRRRQCARASSGRCTDMEALGRAAARRSW